MNGHHPSTLYKVLVYCVIFTKAITYFIYYKYTYSAGMKERCRDGCRTSLLIAGVVLVLAIFHALLPPCHPYITIHFMEMIFSTCNILREWLCCCLQVNCIIYKHFDRSLHIWLLDPTCVQKFRPVPLTVFEIQGLKLNKKIGEIDFLPYLPC